jgi:multidrug efflux pump subunit AcrA (membrane-fusion protein)
MMQNVIVQLKKRWKWLVPVFIVMLGMRLCHHPKKPNESLQIITVAPQKLSNTLFYAGTLQPLHAVSVMSPADGAIEDQLFHYGDTVKSGQLLFTVHSEKFQSDYKAALIQYVKARSDMSSANSQLLEGEFLHKNLLISNDDFKVKQTNFYNAQLVFLQAKDALSVLIRQLDIKGFNLYDLTIADIEKITSALHLQEGSRKLQIMAPIAGMVLLPMKSDGGNTDKKIGKGDLVKQGDVLALIGDESGVSIHIAINEFDINQIQVGQAVKVTSSAFPDIVLQGSIAGVDHQAQANQNGMPAFSAEVVVPTLTPEQQKWIHIGMSAKVEVDIQGEQQMMVPIAAITEKNGAAFVKLQDSKTGKLHDVLVKTGKTTTDAVAILEGLKSGDKIAVTD